MKGLQIFTHSLRQVFGNLQKALQLSLVLYLAQIVLCLAVGVNPFDPMLETKVANFSAAQLLVTLIVSLGAGLWIAVGWHRYVLLVEEPQSFVPRFHGDRLLAYLGRSLLIALIAFLIGLVLGFIGGALASVIGRTAPILSAVIMIGVVFVPILVVAFRLSASLPAAALGRDVGIGAGWTATSGQTGALLALAVVCVVASLALNLTGAALAAVAPLLGMVWMAVVGWINMMVGVSILTTIYGHYVEGRPLV